jgi:hypothetical protein
MRRLRLPLARRKMYVVLDSNVWISELGLNSGLGAATRFFIRQQAAQLAVPEVILQQTEAHLRDELTTYIGTIQKNYSKLLSVFGKLKEVVLPTTADIELVIAGLFEDLGVPFHVVPLTLESAQASYEKILLKRPPSQKSQQFKDGVIWADCLALLDQADVHLVTKDRAFYKNMEVKQGLAPELAAEAAKKHHTLHIYSELSDLLESIRVDVEIDQGSLMDTFMAEHQESVERMLARFGFAIHNISRFSARPFATGSPKALHIAFEYEIRCEPTISDGRRDGVLYLSGDVSYDPTARQFSNLRNFGERFSCLSADGEEQSGANHVLFANSIVLGHREVERSVRHPL